jgi:hypothetical protein
MQIHANMENEKGGNSNAVIKPETMMAMRRRMFARRNMGSELGWIFADAEQKQQDAP